MLSDEQYDRKHGVTPSAKGVLLAEKHVIQSVKSLAFAITALILASDNRIKRGNTKESVEIEKAKLADYRDACYDLFFVHVHLIKVCSPEILKKVNDLSLNYCTKATKNLHVTNL